jgi:hypothetical protein
MLGWDQYGFYKKHGRTCYIRLVFFHLVGSAGHILHSTAYGARNVDALFFMIGYAQCGFYKKHAGKRYANFCFSIRWDLQVLYCTPVCLGWETSTQYFTCSGGPGAVSIKSAPRNVMSILCFYIRLDRLVV